MGGHRYRELMLTLALVRLLVRSPWLDVYALAEQIGSTRQTVLRLLRALRETGLVIERRRVEGGRVQFRVSKAAAHRWMEAD